MSKESQVVGNYNGKVLFQNKKYSIELCDILNRVVKPEEKQLVVVIDEIWTDWVMVYDDLNVAFDMPHMTPEYIKKKVRSYAKRYAAQLGVIGTVKLR